jgi:ethanolamine-phosphate cytidylyltransferase
VAIYGASANTQKVVSVESAVVGPDVGTGEGLGVGVNVVGAGVVGEVVGSGDGVDVVGARVGPGVGAIVEGEGVGPCVGAGDVGTGVVGAGVAGTGVIRAGVVGANVEGSVGTGVGSGVFGFFLLSFFFSLRKTASFIFGACIGTLLMVGVARGGKVTPESRFAMPRRVVDNTGSLAISVLLLLSFR